MFDEEVRELLLLIIIKILKSKVLHTLFPNNYKSVLVGWLASKPFMIISKMGQRCTTPFFAPFRAFHTLIVDHIVPPSLLSLESFPMGLKYMEFMGSNKSESMDNLKRRCWMLVNKCFLCKSNKESSEHILLHCINTYKLIQLFCRKEEKEG